ncbi:hypothetical protein HNF24_004427 [Salmonella enterica]|nr:hypothetical protein [Salmonella enterica]EJI2527122.1 hypothetical protein [Salmonella enterica]ELV5184863.1 hypothetical protein [Salmonella enterica]EMD0827596.1 hypothetical protein [Enterobacter hormaechei subsp. hoffmannii]
MKITTAILDAASKTAPGVSRSDIECILTAAFQGQIEMVEGAGKTLDAGKDTYPDQLVVSISDSYTALSLANQLISAAMHSSGQTILERPVQLLFSGEAQICK